jgi:hypothetical protein
MDFIGTVRELLYASKAVPYAGTRAQRCTNVKILFWRDKTSVI